MAEVDLDGQLHDLLVEMRDALRVHDVDEVLEEERVERVAERGVHLGEQCSLHVE